VELLEDGIINVQAVRNEGDEDVINRGLSESEKEIRDEGGLVTNIVWLDEHLRGNNFIIASKSDWASRLLIVTKIDSLIWFVYCVSVKFPQAGLFIEIRTINEDEQFPLTMTTA
jgi:hypothetical protein